MTKTNGVKLNHFNGFSLIELSIVLIIIGLLVAGVTGGASLIESAKIRALINEVKGYQQAMYTFYAARDRLPGDLNNDGKTGIGSGEIYDSSSFPAPYNSGNKIPTYTSAPFVDMYLEGIIDFAPGDTSGQTSEATLANNGAIPTSKILKTYSYSIWTKINTQTNPLYWQYNTSKFKNILVLKRFKASESAQAKFFKKIDEKLDDGIYNKGIIRSACSGTSSNGYNDYDNSVSNKGVCTEMNIFIIGK